MTLRKDEYWKAYSNEDLAIRAMGAPTLEMFADSYNKKYPNCENGKLEWRLKKSEDSTSFSYCEVRWKKTGDESWLDYGLPSDSKLQDTTSNSMYIKEGYGYWLADRAACWDFVYYVTSGKRGICSSENIPVTGCGIRPVVCLKDDVQVKNENGTWVIQD